MSEEEKEAIERIKTDDEYYDILENIKQNKYNMWNVEKLMRDTTNGNYTEYEIAQSIVYLSNLIEKQQKQLDKIKEYTHQEIVHYTETIKDFIDDDKEGNKYLIGELKEDREHWKDIERIINNDENLYMKWEEFGLYE